MRFVPTSSRPGLAALVASTFLASSAAVHAQTYHNPAYAFAQQKVYGMTITDGNGSKATITAKPFSMSMQTAATYDTIGTQTFNAGLDPKQAFVTPTGDPKPGENWSGNVPPNGGGVFSNPARERVLLQNAKTPWGDPQALRLDLPTATDFTPGANFARADGYVTKNPDTTVGPDASGVTPTGTGWNQNGVNIAAGKLFQNVGTPGTLSIDSVAEVLLTSSPHDTHATSVSNWTATGKFDVANNTHGGGDTKVTFSFNLVERLVVYSETGATLGDAATASNTLAFDVFDAKGISVFSGNFSSGQNPSSTRMLTSVTNFSQTYNNATNGPTHLYPGPKSVEFQTSPLKSGTYTFMITGESVAKAVAVPEPGALAALASAAATLVVVARSRRCRAVACPSVV